MTRRVPVGPCSFITPFNFPLNLTAHKVAPAIAAGCPFVLKPSERTPISAVLIGEVLAATEMPPGSFSVLPCRLDDVAPFIEDERLKLLSFTGSAPIGWGLRARAGQKKVVLELGGNAACIVDGDQREGLVRDVQHGLVEPRIGCPDLSTPEPESREGLNNLRPDKRAPAHWVKRESQRQSEHRIRKQARLHQIRPRRGDLLNLRPDLTVVAERHRHRLLEHEPTRVELVAHGDFVLFAACFDDCVCHSLEKIEVSSLPGTRGAEISTGAMVRQGKT